jgi:hypothetical protein
MTPKELLRKLEHEGITLEPKLTIKADAKPNADTLDLIKVHRDDLLRYLLTEKHGLLIDMCRSSETLVFDAVWCKRCFRYQLEPCSPSTKRYGEGVN